MRGTPASNTLKKTNSNHSPFNSKIAIFQGMCFSLPTPEDPFNDRFDNPRDPRKLVPHNKNKRSPQPKLHQDEDRDKDHKAPDSDQAISKFLILCLNAIQDAWAEEGSFDPNLDAPLLSGTWGFRLWRRCSAPQSDFIDINGVCANREQIAWLVSTASDIFAAKEKQGLTVPNPFLLYLVPSQQKALQVCIFASVAYRFLSTPNSLCF